MFFYIFPFLFLVSIFALVFWVWLLIDAIQYQKENKLMWVLLIVILPVLGSAIYYFLGKNKRIEAKVVEKI
ncbi:MAG: hypothetical protein A2538_05105 [Candidatus Magasanikbacteria bacterium RIFOXYD2_FULL_41_14]|uniref:Cardiolipin synthase N-terminal domain-containing protein n=1 Tax=Candidatus Magasanikbacteria bacterium RIFOXYD2_FULL_41_14 TaxID=1798709 RepID=A0A1F6PG60_9BACT|nr:MAG: hypothetical protein A2538_05105 [Candidatus Magasanikbacteria bacterium RIFOXYD2_FULL_41_14]